MGLLCVVKQSTIDFSAAALLRMIFFYLMWLMSIAWWPYNTRSSDVNGWSCVCFGGWSRPSSISKCTEVPGIAISYAMGIVLIRFPCIDRADQYTRWSVLYHLELLVLPLPKWGDQLRRVGVGVTWGIYWQDSLGSILWCWICINANQTLPR